MRVLVIEDEIKIAAAVQRYLTKESFAVDVAYTGEEGLLTALAQGYDIIILDRMLPDGRDGVEICLELRKAGIQCPIIMLTAKGQIENRIEGLNAGADDYLVKPFALGELTARINALLRRPQNTITNTLQVGDLTLDTVNKQAARAGETIILSPKEYALLEYMMRNAGRILSKQNLISHVWDFDADILPTNIESFMTFLRRKIDKPFAGRPLLHTVRGFGYKIEDEQDA